MELSRVRVRVRNRVRWVASRMSIRTYGRKLKKAFAEVGLGSGLVAGLGMIKVMTIKVMITSGLVAGLGFEFK